MKKIFILSFVLGGCLFFLPLFPCQHLHALKIKIEPSLVIRPNRHVHRTRVVRTFQTPPSYYRYPPPVDYYQPYPTYVEEYIYTTPYNYISFDPVIKFKFH